jgi:outer membrane murein-binding lipoprotein Lpp
MVSDSGLALKGVTMDNGISTVRNLLYIVLVLTLLSIFANFYVGTQLARNSDELDGLRQLLAKEMMGTAIDQSQQLQKRMDQLNQDAAGIDAKLQKAQDDFVARMNQELPKTMDNYFRTRAPLIERQMMQQVPH